ncbi:hypothetical protein AMELA_G00179880 [Ameiurus melas]|uniref:Uncharacterized protein n=1 Tax=Ameiurus melas TaxID=219545 RepID=A0A7J6A9Z2_AMEME|nr:hypothetical protein AMELA_G00179880 [Ameiurus melas]
MKYTVDTHALPIEPLHRPRALWTRPHHAFPLARRVYSPTELKPCTFFSWRTWPLVSTESANSPLGTTAEISERQ